MAEVCFQDLFTASNGKPIQHNGQTIQMMDTVPVEAGQRVQLRFLSTASKWRQGVYLWFHKGSFEIEHNKLGGLLGTSLSKHENAIVLWSDTTPKTVNFTVWPASEGLLVKNVWDGGDGVMHSWHNGGALIVEASGPTRRYLCNDGFPDDDFDDLVFELALLSRGTA